MDVNTITLQGHLGKDAETRFTTNGTAVTNFSLATNTSKNGRPDWHKIVTFGHLAEDMKPLRKGDYVRVSGELRSREYEVSKDGATRIAWEIRAHDFEKLERPVRNGSPAPVAEEVPR